METSTKVPKNKATVRSSYITLFNKPDKHNLSELMEYLHTHVCCSIIHNRQDKESQRIHNDKKESMLIKKLIKEICRTNGALFSHNE